MTRFSFSEAILGGVHVVKRELVSDERGYLERLFCAETFAPFGFSLPVAQINHTLTRRRGAVRGFHYQRPPHAEDKLVTCIKGSVFDIALDLRHDSPTFLKWHAEELSETNGKALLIPQGFAHGFQALTQDCELVYLHSRPYTPSAEGGVNVRSPALGLFWPLEISELSTRDAMHPIIDQSFQGIKS